MMAPDRKRNDDEEAIRTAEALRLLKALSAVKSQPLREALIVLTEHLAGRADRRD